MIIRRFKINLILAALCLFGTCISGWAFTLWAQDSTTPLNQNRPITTITQWEVTPVQGEKQKPEQGNPVSIAIPDQPFAQARWIAGPDGSLAVLAGPGQSNKGGIIVSTGSLRLKEGQEVVFPLRRYQYSGENGWKSLHVGLMNNAGHTLYFNLSPKTGFFSAELPEWQSLGSPFEFKPPVYFSIQKKEGKLFFYKDEDLLFSFDDLPEAPYNQILIGITILHPNDAVLAEFGPVEIREIAIPPPPPPLPSAKEFPKIIIGSVMLWSTPYSPRFILGDEKLDYAGSYENAPLVPLSDSEDSRWLPKQYFSDLKAAGIDAIDQCYFDGMSLSTIMGTAEAARQSGTGIKVLPMIDIAMTKDRPTFLQKFWEYKKLREHPNVLKVGNVPVVITFGYFGPDSWREIIANAEKAGGRFFIIGDTNCIEIAVTDKVPTERFREGIELVSGLYYFGSHTLAWQDTGILPDFMKFGRSFSTPKVVGAGIVPGYISSTRVGNLLDPRGTYLLRRQWLEAIECNPDFIYLTTMNDYTEDTVQECSANATYSFIDLNAYFGSRWRNGKFPIIVKPQAFLSYRKAVSVNEPVELELVLLRPEMTGKEPTNEIERRFKAEVKIRLKNDREIVLESVTPEVLPGHLCWRFWTKTGLGEDGYAIPAVRVSVDGKEISLPKGQLAPFAVVRNGEEVARTWLYVPLHRVREGVKARVVVKGSPGNLYPRTICVEDLPWQEVAGGIVERGANPLYTTLPPNQLQEGFQEEFFTGPGWAPMRYQDGWVKRCVIDQVDRYTAVIRMKDNTFVYPTPALVDPPKVDPATITDFIITPKGDTLVDRGGMHRNLDLGKPDSPSRPAIRQDEPGKPYYLRFDGVDDQLDLGALSVPPGPATLDIWFRPLSIGKSQVLFDSWGAALSVGITSSGNLALIRVNQKRQEVKLEGKNTLKQGEWYNIVAVFNGNKIALYLNGQPDGQPVAVTGLRTDEKSIIGYGSGMLKILAGLHDIGYLHGDIARFRILQHSFTSEEVANNYQSLIGYFK